MVAEEMRRAAQAAPLERLCEVTAALWKAFAVGGVSEAEAEELSTLIEARRAVGKSPDLGTSRVRKFADAQPHRPQRPPIQSVAIERRRRLAASGPMPPALAARFTVAELATLKVIGDDLKRSGVCVLPIDAIAARAGVSRTSAQNAIRQACRLGMLERQERRRAGANSLTNILRVVDREWSAWLKRGSAGGGLKSLSTTDTRGLREGERHDRQGNPGHVARREYRPAIREGGREMGSGRVARR